MGLRENKIYTVIFTFIFSFLFLSILSIINLFTYEKINSNKTLFQKKAIMNSMKIKFTNDKEAPGIYDKTVKSIKVDGRDLFYAGEKNDRTYALIFSGNGLWGTITGVIGFNRDLTRTTGIDIISHSETPGLGGRIEEEWFKRMYENELIVGGQISVIMSSGTVNYDHENGQVDSITGATLTSNYMKAMINETISEISDYIKGGINE